MLRIPFNAPARLRRTRKASKPMTIAIGLRASSHQPPNPKEPARATLLLCADTMATYVAGATAVSSSQAQSKIYPLAHGFYAAFSDDYYWSHQVLTWLYQDLLNLDPTDSALMDKVKDSVSKAFEYAWLWYRGEVLRDEVGITEDEYLHDTKLTPDLRDHAKSVWHTKCGEVPSSIVLAGQTPNGPLLLTANYSSLREGADYYAVGEGESAALDWLNYRGYNQFAAVPRAFFHMREAKRFAEIKKFVGANTQYVLITERGESYELRERGSLMDNWDHEFHLRDTDVLERDERRISFETAFGVKL